MTTIIALIISLGLIGSPEAFNDLPENEQQELVDIVIAEDENI